MIFCLIDTSFRYLHSNMVLLQFVRQLHFDFRNLIYIPIWFYFNQKRMQEFATSANLHSNMVLLQLFSFCSIPYISLIYILIWFYFNFLLHNTNLLIQPHLHSNMVLLQSASHVMQRRQNPHLHSNMVLLQSVTNIGKAILHLIYIPIWFYFNGAARSSASIK